MKEPTQPTPKPPKEPPTAIMKQVLKELSSVKNVLIGQTWFSRTPYTSDVAKSTLQALLRRGLVQKTTIEVYTLTDAGRQELEKGKKWPWQ